jgi:hypothetical protein
MSRSVHVYAITLATYIALKSFIPEFDLLSETTLAFMATVAVGTYAGWKADSHDVSPAATISLHVLSALNMTLLLVLEISRLINDSIVASVLIPTQIIFLAICGLIVILVRPDLDADQESDP